MPAPTQDVPATGPSTLRVWARACLVTFLGFTALYCGYQAWLRLRFPDGVHPGAGQVATLLLLTLPFVIALTLPAAVLVAAAHAFSRPAARARSLGRQLRSTLLAACGLGLGIYLLVDQVLPRTNTALRQELIALSSGGTTSAPARVKGDREMTIAELSAVVRQAEADLRQATAPGDQVARDAAASRAAQYRVEIEKKRALAAASMVFVLVGAGLGLRLAGRRAWFPAAAAAGLFALYYAGLILGEQLANGRVISPLLGMWAGNIVLAALGGVLLWQASRTPRAVVPVAA